MAVDVGEVELALFRDAQGVAHALVDRCPHRSVRLSLGRVTQGCLECPYHGWRFAGDGACTLVPLHPDAKREQLGAIALPTVERGGLIWVFTDEQASAEDPQVRAGPLVPEFLERKDMRRRESEFPWACHWTRLAENMLDFAHLPYVHRRTIGRGMPTQTGRLHVEEADHGFTLRWSTADEAHPVPAGKPWLQWWRPNMSVLELTSPIGEYRQHLLSVPGKRGQTRLLLVSTRRFKFGLDILLRPLLDWFEDRIVNEDKPVISSSDPAVVPLPGFERSVACDGAALRFRKWYHQRQRLMLEQTNPER